MLQHELSLSFHIFCHMLLLVSTATAADYIYVECSGVYFTRLTPYETNVNSLFSSLVDSASVTNFNKFEISQTDVVYGLYQCRGDLESSKCKDCVASSVNQLKTACPLSVGGSIQLDGCFLKYDNKPFFGVQSTVEVKKRCGPSIGYNTDILYNRDDALVNLIAGNGKYFHGGDYGSIRGVAQCVQDLSLSDCQDCLSEASGRLRSQCETSSWGDIFLEKCYIRYHDRDIGHSSNNNSKDDGGGNNSKLMKTIAYVIGVILAISGAASVSVTICKFKYKVSNKNIFYGTEITQKRARSSAPASTPAPGPGPGPAPASTLSSTSASAIAPIVDKHIQTANAERKKATTSENHKAEGANQKGKNKKEEEPDKNKKQVGEGAKQATTSENHKAEGAKQKDNNKQEEEPDKNKKQVGEGAKQQGKNKKQQV